MPKVKMSTRLPAGADRVWKTVGGFNALPDWHPAVEKSEIEGEGDGAVRTLTLAGGGTITERLEASGDRSYEYKILSGPLPVANYTATIEVTEDGDGESTVAWSSDFDSAGVPDSDAQKAIQDVYRAGLDNLKKMFGM